MTAARRPADSTGRGDRPWLALTVELPDGRADELAGELALGTLGVRLGPARDGRRTAVVYADAAAGGAALLERAATLERVHGLGPNALRSRVEPVEDGRWVERYQRGLQPFALGRRFVVQPGECAPAPGERRLLRLVPGRAFGTGEHPTTRLCAAALETHVGPESRWGDLGTGSGILAVVAVCCGAARVDAVDIDPQAVEVARRTVETNGVADRIVLAQGTAERLPCGGLDGVVANISASFFLGRAPLLLSRLAAGGVAIASGFLAEQRQAVEAALARAGGEIVEREVGAGWSLAVVRRVGSGGRG